MTLALGTGAKTTIFSVVNDVILKPLAWDAPQEFLFVQTGSPSIRFDEFWLSAPENLECRDAIGALEAISTFNTGEMSLTGGDTLLRVMAGFPAALPFATFGMDALGHTFMAEVDSPRSKCRGGERRSLEPHLRALESVRGESAYATGVSRSSVGVLRLVDSDSGVGSIGRDARGLRRSLRSARTQESLLVH